MTLIEAIQESKELNEKDKNDFKNIKIIIESINNDLDELLFSVEFINKLTKLVKIKEQTTKSAALIFCLKDILMKDILTTLFRLWDSGKDVNSLLAVGRLINGNKSLKEFIINLPHCDNITKDQVKKIIEDIPHTSKHALLTNIKRYRTENIGHNLQKKSKTDALPHSTDKLYLGNIMIYADRTIKYANDLHNVVFEHPVNFFEFEKDSEYILALEEIENILDSKGFMKNSSIRKGPLQYEDDSGFAKELLSKLS